MKYLIIVGDGMADERMPQLGGKSPLEVADIPTINRLARQGVVGHAQNCPPGFSVGSDIAHLSILGCDPSKHFHGRGPMEAAALGFAVEPTDAVFRCNLLTMEDGDGPLDEKGFVSTVNRLRFPLSERVSDDLERALVDTGARAVRGAIASGDQFVSEPDAKAAIAEHFDASVCEMEGGAIAHVCLLNEIPCCILRAISDGADDGAALTYAEFAERAAHVSAKAMIRYLEAYA